MVSTSAPIASATITDQREQHSIVQSAVLHLLPGLLGTLVYVFAVPTVRRLGFPALFAIYLAIPVIIAVELGYLFYQGKLHNRRLSLHGVVLYRAPLPLRQYLAFVPLSLLWAALVSGLIAPIDNFLALTLFSWLPDWYLFKDVFQYAMLYSRSALLMTLGTGLILNGIVGPIAEELYFRGYLLPRLARFGVWAPILNAALFSLYHFWMPWQFVSRVLVVLSWAYLAWRKQNVYLGIWAHCLLNVIGTLLTFAAIFR